MSESGRIESRGIRCLECRGLDLRKLPDAAKAGFGWCSLAPIPHYVAITMSRNCCYFVPRPANQVAELDEWANETEVLFWRRK